MINGAFHGGPLDGKTFAYSGSSRKVNYTELDGGRYYLFLRDSDGVDDAAYIWFSNEMINKFGGCLNDEREPTSVEEDTIMMEGNTVLRNRFYG